MPRMKKRMATVVNKNREILFAGTEKDCIVWILERLTPEEAPKGVYHHDTESCHWEIDSERTFILLFN